LVVGRRRLLGGCGVAGVTRALPERPVGAILVAIGVLATQHALHVVRETLAVGFAGHDDLGTRKIAVASLVARSLSTLGLATITGFALRLRLYEAWGLEKRDVATLTLYNEVTYYVGLTVTLGAAFLIADVPTMVAAGVALPSPMAIGVIATGLAVTYVVLSLRRTAPWRFRTYEVPVVAVADGATLAQTGGGDDDMTPPPGARTFTTDIYPRLKRASLGGLGCANCHTAGGVAAILQFDLPVAEAHAAILARPGVIAPPATAALSLLLTKPLYEDPPNHPNATFLTALDPDYLIIMEWISQGAPL